MISPFVDFGGLPIGLKGILPKALQKPRMNPCPDCNKPTQGTNAKVLGAIFHSPRCKACFDKKVAESPHLEAAK